MVTLCPRFNSRSREGSDIATATPIVTRCVSIHAPARGATFHRCTLLDFSCFNSRSREGSDSSSNSRWGSALWFQFTLPRGERRYRLGNARRNICFNSRSREGSDGNTQNESEGYQHVSIHAPARGATPREHPITTPIGCFNSRSREGSD